MNAEQFFNNGFGADVEKVHRKHVIDLMTNFAKHYHTEQCNIANVVGQSEQYFCSKEQMEKLKKNTVVTTNIEFKHSIGQRGRYTGKVLQSVQDCKDEIKALLDSEHFVSQMLYMVSTFKQYI